MHSTGFQKVAARQIHATLMENRHEALKAGLHVPPRHRMAPKAKFPMPYGRRPAWKKKGATAPSGSASDPILIDVEARDVDAEVHRAYMAKKAKSKERRNKL